MSARIDTGLLNLRITDATTDHGPIVRFPVIP